MSKKLVDRITNIGINSLLSAHATYNALGVDGKEETKRENFLQYLAQTSGQKDLILSAEEIKDTNPDASLLSDIELETAVVNIFRACRLPITFSSEELGDTKINSNGRCSEYFGVIDGLDGTSVFKEKGPKKGRQATMLGVFYGRNPSYGDYIFSGILEHAKQRLFFASRGLGAFEVDLNKPNHKERIHTSYAETFDKSTPISADGGFDKWAGITVIDDIFLSRLQGFNISVPKASETTYVDLVTGKVAIGLECTRGGKKKNLEPAAAYGLVVESGGLITDYSGESIQDQKYIFYGHGDGNHIPIIAAANRGVLANLVNYLNKSN